MSSRVFRPENAQKRAKEFLDVGKPNKALEVLYEVIRRGKMRNNCSEKVLEPIMILYLDLCVDQKKSHLAKEGLYQYRNIFQDVNVQSLERVVLHYLALAEERTNNARKESHEAVSGVDDLDNIATPEELLLKAVSGEDAQDRSDRTILTPWVKFLWESYRQCLELLRNNSRVEKLYHETAKTAFNFCERYQRKTEFRKLCDNLVNHMQHLQKAPTSARGVSLSNPETQQMNLETRLEQLNYAIKMELWQEAYRAIEYVSDLMSKSKKSPKPQIMASYYQKLSLVFWKAGNQLFHAAALLKLFQLNKEQKKNITAEELGKKAAVVLAATLAIPLPSAHPEFDRFMETEKSALEKVAKLAALLNLQKPPTRIGLFKELSRCGVLAAVSPELQNLHEVLEVSFDPLNLCHKMKTQLVWVSAQPELEQYVPAIEHMSVTRLIKQLAQIYSTINFDRLLELAVFMEPFKLERVLVDLVRHNDLQIRVDHRNKCVHFGSALSESQREDLPEGPALQDMPSESIRCQLIHMNNALYKCIQMIEPDARKKEMVAIRSQCIQAYNQTRVRDQNRFVQRQMVIEMRKERLESQTLEREESIRRAQEELALKQKLEEQERLKREATEREKQRHEEQRKQIHTKQIKDKLLQISQTSYGQKMIEKFNEEELLSLDADEILHRQVEELEKERKEVQQKLKGQEKKHDYMERAKRLHEIPKFKEMFAKQKESDRETWVLEEEKRLKKLAEDHQKNLEMSKRFNHMKTDLNVFLDELKSARRSETEKKMNDFNARLAVEKKKRLLDRKEQRRKERREVYLREKREEKQRIIDEEAKKEREAQEAEELERQRKEEEEYQRKKDELDKAERKRKEKEMEIERKMREKEGGGGVGQKWRDSREPGNKVEASSQNDGLWRRNEGNSYKETEQEKLAAWKRNPSSGPVYEPPRRDKGLAKDIRLDDDYNMEQRRRDQDRDDMRSRVPNMSRDHYAPRGNRDEFQSSKDEGFSREDFGKNMDRSGYYGSNRGRDNRGGRDDRGSGRDDRGSGRDDRGSGRDDRGMGRDGRDMGRDGRFVGNRDGGRDNRFGGGRDSRFGGNRDSRDNRDSHFGEGRDGGRFNDDRSFKDNKSGYSGGGGGRWRDGPQRSDGDSKWRKDNPPPMRSQGTGGDRRSDGPPPQRKEKPRGDANGWQTVGK